MENSEMFGLGIGGTINGPQLKYEMENTSDEKEALIEGFLYKNSVLMIYADSGLGKSVVTLNAMAQLCSGNKVFGHLNVSEEYEKPFPHIYWILAERSKHEPLSRLKQMSKGIKDFRYSNFTLDHQFQGFNLLDPNDQMKALFRIQQVHAVHKIDVVVFDPIYALVAGGLSEDKPATMFTRFSTLVQTSLGCTNVLIHHTNRGGRDKAGERTKGDMYGSRWIDAHIDGAFHLHNNGNDAYLTKTKDNHGVLLKKIPLFYDASTMLSWMPENGTTRTKLDDLKDWLKVKKSTGETFTFDDMRDGILVSSAKMRDFLTGQQKLGIEECSKSLKGKKIYRAV